MTKTIVNFYKPIMLLNDKSAFMLRSLLALLNRGKFCLALTLVALLLSACAYDGLSGSSGGDFTGSGSSPAGECLPQQQLSGLWVQNEQSVIVDPRNDGQDVGTGSCACWNAGALNRLERCYSYFSNGKIISGYLSARASEYDNCATPYNPSANELRNIINRLEEIAQNRDRIPPDASIVSGAADGSRPTFAYAIGGYELHGEGPVTNAADLTVPGVGPNNNITTGCHFDIVYPDGANGFVGRDRICSAYNLQGDILYLATEPSSGRTPQSLDPRVCGSSEERYIQLINYSKFPRP